MTTASSLFDITLALGDDALVLGHRLSEWSGKAPTLEEDIALSNLGLDLIGQARLFYAYAGELEGKGRTEDDLAYFRNAAGYRNLLIVELDIGDFAHVFPRLERMHRRAACGDRDQGGEGDDLSRAAHVGVADPARRRHRRK